MTVMTAPPRAELASCAGSATRAPIEVEQIDDIYVVSRSDIGAISSFGAADLAAFHLLLEDHPRTDGVADF